jgi:hypothetical protein
MVFKLSKLKTNLFVNINDKVETLLISALFNISDNLNSQKTMKFYRA